MSEVKGYTVNVFDKGTGKLILYLVVETEEDLEVIRQSLKINKKLHKIELEEIK